MTKSIQTACAALLLLGVHAPAASAQTPEATPKSIHAIGAAGLGSAMSYCIAKYGPLRQGSPAANCYARARGILAGADARGHAARADATCADPATFNQCITPEVGRFVYALTEEFARQEL